jgi:RNA polymerase sigma factor (sigma-70 family)
MTVEAIIQGCKEGNRKSQDALVHSFAPVLMAICIRYVGDREVAQDALQETFISAFKYIHTYKGSGSFEGWLRRIAVTSSLLVKKKYTSFNFESMDEVTPLSQNTIPDAYAQMSFDELLLLIEKLPPSLLAVFNLNVIDGFTHGEIADILGITESTSRAALTKARVRLIELIKKNDQITFQWAAAL